MIIWQDKVQCDFCVSVNSSLFTEQTLFFDIETTGFSREYSTLYMIGCAFREGDYLYIEQFFAETPKQQAEILTAFLSLLAKYDTIITFNGDSFDIPFVKSKYQCLFKEVPDPFEGKRCIDIFKTANHLKAFLNLCDCRQKTVEKFFGICREDLCTGGELIAVYQNYVKKPSAEAYSLLRLHNYEDVLHMTYLLSIFNYQSLLDGEFTICSVAANEYQQPALSDHTYLHNNDSAAFFSGKELFFTLQLNFPVPKRITCSDQDFYLRIKRGEAHLRIRLFEGELKYFFPDYKNYYYLPAEDTAVHKNVAASVAKQFRKKATAATCYTKKYGIFLPQCKEMQVPALKQERKDKKTYFELTEQFILSKNAQKEYILHIFEYLLSRRK